MAKASIIVRMDGGKVLNRDKVAAFFAALPDGANYLEARPWKKRSLPQNDWFHAILPDVAQALREVGYNEIRNVNDAKNFLKSLFFKKVITNGIDTVEIIEGTSEQSKENFSSKAEDIIIWAKEYLGIDIAPPGIQTEIDYYAAVATYEKDLNVTIIQQA